MAKDERLWMRFPIDMHRDPKVTRLSDKAFRVFFEMNGEARLEQNDGTFTKDDAEFRWPPEILAELVRSHPTEPLVVVSSDCYRLRRFAKHQFTEADRETLANKRAEAGKAGAEKRWGSKPIASATPSVASAMANDGKAWQAIAESESESELETDTSNTGQSSHLSDRASNVDLTDQHVSAIQAELAHHADIEATADEARAFGGYVLSNAKTAPRNRAAYVKSSIAYNPTEVSQWFRQHRRTGRAAS